MRRKPTLDALFRHQDEIGSIQKPKIRLAKIKTAIFEVKHEGIGYEDRQTLT